MKFDLASSAIKALGSAKIFETINSNIVIIPRVTKGRSSLSFSQLSEGTFKSIALLFYLITDQSNLLLIEEPEVCVHHGLLNHLIATIKAFSNQKQIIFSTHSDFVLDSLKPENVFLVKNSEKQGTTVKSIAKALSKQNFKALKEYLATEGNLGDYWRSGGIDA
jgi:predicted ATPase